MGAGGAVIVFGDHAHAHRISTAAGTLYNPIADQCISRTTDEGELLGGVVFQAYTGASIAIHMAGFIPTWANRDILWAAFHYPFEQLKVRQVLGQVPESNEAALEINRKLGFKEVARIAGVYDDGAAVIMAIQKDECRWLKLTPRALSPRHATGG
jgi:RimJ/RimL family protein N-acetyltransferase